MQTMEASAVAEAAAAGEHAAEVSQRIQSRARRLTYGWLCPHAFAEHRDALAGGCPMAMQGSAEAGTEKKKKVIKKIVKKIRPLSQVVRLPGAFARSLVRLQVLLGTLLWNGG